MWTFGEVDAFADSILKKGVPPPPKFGPVKAIRDAMNAPLTQLFDGAKYEFHYTTDGGQWQKRKWKTVPAEWRDNVISAAMPEGRPLTAYFSTIDANGLEASSEHVEVAAP
jgi:hypothetical protein